MDNEENVALTGQRFLNKALSQLGDKAPLLTEKLQGSLIRGLDLARQLDSIPGPSHLMHGLIATKSVVISILDSLGMDVAAYARRLRADKKGQLGHIGFRGLMGFFGAYATLLSCESPTEPYVCRIISCARNLAEVRQQPVVDTATFVRAMLREALHGSLALEDDLPELMRRPLSQQLIQEFAVKSGDADTLTTDAVSGIWAADRDDNGSSCLFVESIISELLVDISRLSSLDLLEHSLEFANHVEPFIDNSRFMLVPGQLDVRLREFNYLNLYGCSEEKGAVASKISTFSGAGVLTWSHIHEFEALINKSRVTEWDMHKFFEKNPRFLLGAQYQQLHSQIILLRDDGSRMIPDFFAERVGSNFADIIELKKPSARLISGARTRAGLASALTRALNQVREYRNYFDDAVVRRNFHRKYGFEAFRPAITVVIGRSASYLDHMQRVRIEDEYKNLQILTYDDILQRAKRLALHI